MTATTVYQVIMNILLPIVTEDQNILTLLLFFHEELINHLLINYSLKKKTKKQKKHRKAPVLKWIKLKLWPFCINNEHL